MIETVRERDLELVNKVLAENPYPAHTFVAQNRTVEISRCERHARTIALIVLRERAKQIDAALYPESSR